MSDDLLTPEQACELAGVPAHQLRAWAYDKVGPRNLGSRHRPMYRAEDVEVWIKARSYLEPGRQLLNPEQQGND